MRRLVGLTGALLLAACAVLAASDDFDAVMNLLAARRHGEVSFVEQHFLSMLKRPAESTGELIYDATGRLEKRTLEPRPETLVLEGNVVTIERDHHTRVVDLTAYPKLLPVVESLRATLAGDRAALERLFHVEFSGDAARWTLILVPLGADLKTHVAEIQIDGSRDTLFKVEIRQPDGDRSLMTLRAH